MDPKIQRTLEDGLRTAQDLRSVAISVQNTLPMRRSRLEGSIRDMVHSQKQAEAYAASLKGAPDVEFKRELAPVFDSFRQVIGVAKSELKDTASNIAYFKRAVKNLTQTRKNLTSLMSAGSTPYNSDPENRMLYADIRDEVLSAARDWPRLISEVNSIIKVLESFSASLSKAVSSAESAYRALDSSSTIEQLRKGLTLVMISAGFFGAGALLLGQPIAAGVAAVVFLSAAIMNKITGFFR